MKAFERRFPGIPTRRQTRHGSAQRHHGLRRVRHGDKDNVPKRTDGRLKPDRRLVLAQALCHDADKVTRLSIPAFDVEQGLIELPGTPAGKGDEPPPEPGAGGAKIEVEGWRPGDLVVWDDARPSLRGDTYVLGEHIYEAVELYCVEPDCGCGELIVDFGPVVPRGAPHPGHIELDGTEATLRPDHERHRARLTELWTAYCRRHADHRERFARRRAIMHSLAGRIVAAPPKPKVGRNAPCPCGSGRKLKQCCGAA